MKYNRTPPTRDPQITMGGATSCCLPPKHFSLIVLYFNYFKRGGGTIKSGGGIIIRVTGTITPPSMGNCATIGGGAGVTDLTNLYRWYFSYYYI